MPAKKRAVHTQADSPPSLELNPLAAGFQTSFEKGDTAYCLDDMNRFPILPLYGTL
jgi:hypothetical protein